MTGKRSSHSSLHTSGKKSIARHDLSRILKQNAGLCAAGLILFLLLIPFATAGIAGDSIFDLSVTHDQMKFRLIHPDYLLPLYIILLLYALVLGLFTFRFLHDKRQSTLFFSIGLRREKLYLIRFSAGALGLLAGIFVPMLVSLCLNIAALGSYEGLAGSCLYVAAGLFLQGLIVYIITALACILAGTLAESLLYTALFLAGMTGILYSVNRLLLADVWGNALQATTYSGTEVLAGLTEQTASYNPLFFFYENALNCSMLYADLTDSSAAALPAGLLILWAVIAAVLFTAALLFFCRRRAEQAGTNVQHRVLSFVLVLVSLFVVFAVVYVLFADSGRVFAVLFGLVAAVLLYAVWQAGYLRLALKKAGHIRSAAVCAAVSLIAAVLIIAGGGLQKSNLPDDGSVASVQMTYAGSPVYLAGEASGSSSDSSYYMVSEYTYTESSEIDTVLALHETLQALGFEDPATDAEDFSETVVPYDIQISYTLANGSRRTWYYDRASLAILEEMLVLDETGSVRDTITAVITDPEEAADSWAAQAYANGMVYLTNVWYVEPYELSLDDDTRQELLAAVAADVSAQSIEDRYFPEEDALGVLFFTTEGEDDIETFSYHLGNAAVYITEEFTHTLAFLKEYDLLYCMEYEAEIESIILKEFDPYASVVNGRETPLSNLFLGYLSESSDSFFVQEDYGSSTPVTDPDRIETISARLRSTYYMTREGWLAAVKLKGSDQWVYKYMPGGLDLTE